MRYFHAQSNSECKMNFVVQATEVREEKGMVFSLRGPFTVQSYKDFAYNQGKRIKEPNTAVRHIGFFDEKYSFRELKRCPSGLGKKFREMRVRLARDKARLS